MRKKNHKNQHFRRFITHLINSLLIGFIIIVASLGIGMWGYHHHENMGWIDAYMNASMTLSGVGSPTALYTDNGKIFAGTYSLFSGIIFLLVIGIIFFPIFHRMTHKLHPLEDKENDER